MPLVSARGATTCPANEPEAVSAATRELLTALVRANPALTPESTLAAFFTVTPDLNSAFPAAAARALGFTGAALLGAQEAAVPGAPARCVRVLVLFETDDTGRPTRARHGVPVYLGEAAVLRPDLTLAAAPSDREGARR
jgi:chorismate mutase